MFQQKPVKELEAILQSLKSKLAKLDQDAVREKKTDYRLIPSSELTHVLRSQIPVQEKKKLLLHQMGLLRINLFKEYSERIQILEQNHQLDGAVELMNDYASNVAIPFIPRKKSPSLISRFMDLIRRERLEPFESIQEWKSEYQSWVENRDAPLIQQFYSEKFSQLRGIYNTLYTFSFSDDNFPPAPTIIIFDPSLAKKRR